MLRLLDNPMLVSRNSRALSAAILRPAFAVASRVKEVYVLCIGMQRLFELHDGDGDGVILHEEFLNALYAIRKLSSGGPEDQVKCAHSIMAISYCFCARFLCACTLALLDIKHRVAVLHSKR